MRWWRKFLYSKYCRKGSLPPQICSYVELCRIPITKHSLDQIRFVVLDTETTGLDPKSDQILEIGAVAINGNRIVLADRFHVTLAQENLIKSEAVSVHGIMPAEVKDQGMEESRALLQFISYIGNAVLVAHHADFDIQILNQRLMHHFNIRLLNFYLDTYHCAIRMDDSHADHTTVQSQDFSLDSLAERFLIAPLDRHTADGDAFMTAQLFLKLLHKARKKKLRRLKDLLLRA